MLSGCLITRFNKEIPTTNLLSASVTKPENSTGYSLLKREATEQSRKGFVGSHFIVSLQGIIQAYKSGITLQGNSTSLGRWDFSGSFFFSISAITTIGYGNLSPSTAAGRIFCILFALFGIPLNLVLLNEIGQLMLLGVQHCAHRLERVFHWQKKAFLLIKTCALVTGLLLFLLLPPLLFFDKEGWSYEEGFYYSFITLSTIGFGDYVIGMNPDRTYPGWYKNVISLWILFGMAWLALIIKFCINFLESSSDFCQCNKKSTEMAEDLIDGPTEFDSCCHLYIHIEPSHFLIAVVLLAS
uniref:Potassium two pore domain channel subfamily K member 17 n=1 Tax=Athene cunicularia TaxID=194338 RepID=A0A663LLG0_ATHCN